MKNIFLKLLDEKQTLLIDGATGTNLFALGLQSGDSPEFWNTDFPERVASHYRSFIDAGSDIVLTNTFGGNSYRLKLHDAQDRVVEFNRAAARILVSEVASQWTRHCGSRFHGTHRRDLCPRRANDNRGRRDCFC
jgi:5-methyltetrahydrofolate--homocysteine methyltransferase